MAPKQDTKLLPKRVLVVEPDSTLSTMLAGRLQKGTTEVVTAFTLREAQRKITEKQPDCIIMDICISDSELAEVLAFIKKQGSKHGVIVLTNTCEPKTIQQCISHGTQCFLVKEHTSFEEIISQVEKALA